jgi:hypothetical protein
MRMCVFCVPTFCDFYVHPTANYFTITLLCSANWDFSDPGIIGCLPCQGDPQNITGPPPHGDCPAAPCCSDCLCCGPGTIWNGDGCVPAGGGAVEAPCEGYDDDVEKCVETQCEEGDCCGSGTEIIPYPFDEEGSTCFCYPIFSPDDIE